MMAKHTSKKEANQQGDAENAMSASSKGENQLREVIINVAAICVVWVLTYTAFLGFEYLVVIKNSDTGKSTLLAISAGSTVAFLLGPFVMYKVGAKQTLIVSCVCLLVFGASHHKPKAGILIPGGFIVGLGYGFMWTSQGVYITNEAIRYVHVTGTSLKNVLNFMWGIFTMVLASTQIWSNLVSSSVLDTLDVNRSAPHHPYTCGVDMCPDTDEQHAARPNVSMNLNTTTNATYAEVSELSHRERVLITLYIAFSVLGFAITVLFLRQLKTAPTKTETPSTKDLLLSTIKFQCTNRDMILLIPLSLYTGVEQTVILAAFTKNYVLCELGFGWIVFPLICFGFSSAVFSLVSGMLGKYIHWSAQFVFAAALNIAVLAIMLLWTPRSTEKFMFFFIPFVWGIADAIWFTQSAAMFSCLFTDHQEPAFASLRMLQVTGQGIAFKYTKELCADVSLYLCIGLLIVTLVSTAVFETRFKKRKDARLYEELKD